jgi:hypothetical protein
MFCGGRKLRRRKDGFRKCGTHGFHPRRITVYPDGFCGTPVTLVFLHPDDTRPRVIFPFDGIQPRPKNPVDVAAVMRRWKPACGEIPKISFDEDTVICDIMIPDGDHADGKACHDSLGRQGDQPSGDVFENPP